MLADMKRNTTEAIPSAKKSGRDNRRDKRVLNCWCRLLFFVSVMATVVLHIFASMESEQGMQATDTTVIRANDNTRRLDSTHESRCNDGPYIWDVSQHLEGIGSTFQHRKYGLILADALGGKWMGTLKNKHDFPPRANHMNFFGLGGGDLCEESDFLLENIINFSSIRPRVRLTKLCQVIRKMKHAAFRKLHNITKSSIILLEGDRQNEQWNRCLFNDRFRQRFQNAQDERGVKHWREKRRSETWITVHYRWGDTEKWSKSVERKGRRNIAGLTKLAKYVRNEVVRGQKNVAVNFISEGNASLFQTFTEIIPQANILLDLTWQEAIDLMSQSDILVGGSSSFFVLGAHLCKNCTVVTTKTNHKFEMQGSKSSKYMRLCSLKSYSKGTCR